MTVSSVHCHDVEKPAHRAEVAEIAPHGLIEGFSVSGVKPLAAGAHWRAEWRYDEHGLATEPFRELGEAARDRARERRGRR